MPEIKHFVGLNCLSDFCFPKNQSGMSALDQAPSTCCSPGLVLGMGCLV